jgi:polysaccharide biosynthesis/export protein ExoF
VHSITSQFRRVLSLWRPAARAAAVLVLAASSVAVAEEYRLDSQDKVSVRVVEWQTVEGTFREWAALNGDYTVSASGKLSLPLVGELPAAGRTTGDIAQKISETLQQKFGLVDLPEAAVQIAEYRPFYISGDVQGPGQYPYAPGLTVLRAVSIAGGLRREPGGARAERDLINAKGNSDALSEERLRLMVRRARIESELEGKAEIELPEEIASNEKLPSILADEKAIMHARQEKLRLQLQALDDLEGLLEREIASLEKKIETQARQVELAREELRSVGSLAEKGLVVNTRVLSSERTIAEMEGKLLDFETAILRARQDISKATQDAVNLKSGVESELAVERQEVEAKLIENNIKLETQRGLMAEALALAPSAIQRTDARAEPAISIVRSVNGRVSTILADENSSVWPGDVIKVNWEQAPEPQFSGQ